MIVPTRPGLWLCGMLLAASLPILRWPEFASLWLSLSGLACGALLADVWMVRRTPPLRATRSLAHNLALNNWHPVELVLLGAWAGPRRVSVFDHYPPQFEAADMPRDLLLVGHRQARLDYRVRPRARGDATFPLVEVLVDSPLGLWRRRDRIAQAHSVRVYPDFAEISHYALLATENRLSALGIRQRPRRGSGKEFHQLREYRDGDSLRQIDWKATSRYRKLIAREFQDERDQQVIFMLDCGRRMRHLDEGRMHLDEALNAALLLAYVAATQGDAVGFFAFAGVDRWIPPRKGRQVVNRLLDQLYDVAPTAQAADYVQAATVLLTQVRRRALIVLLTNTRDEDYDDLQTALRMLQRRHLIVLADLYEAVLDETLAREVTDLDHALGFHALSQFREARRRQHEILHHSGALTLDVQPQRLPIALVNQYLDVKRSGRL